MPFVKELALQWWEDRQKELDWQEQSQTFDFLERYLLRFLGEEELTTLTQARMDAYFTQLLFEQSYRNPTDRKQVMYGKPILQGIFDYAIQCGVASSLPKADLSFRLNIKTKTAPVGCDFGEEIIRQIQYLIACEERTLTGLALGLAYYAGFNREEILSLRRSHVDPMKRKVLHADGRAVSLVEPLEHMLHWHLQQEREGEDRLLFISKRKTPFAGPSLSHLVKLAKEKHGVYHEDIGLNALRNQYILQQLNTIPSEDLPALAAGLGASPINLINTFGHFLVPEKREVYAIAGVL